MYWLHYLNLSGMAGSRDPNNVTRTHSFSLHLSTLLSLITTVNVPAYLLRLTRWPNMGHSFVPEPISVVRRMHYSDWANLGLVLNPGIRIESLSPKPCEPTVGESCFPKECLGITIRT